MAKAKFERNKPHCNIGTIGHVAPSQRDRVGEQRQDRHITGKLTSRCNF